MVSDVRSFREERVLANLLFGLGGELMTRPLAPSPQRGTWEHASPGGRGTIRSRGRLHARNRHEAARHRCIGSWCDTVDSAMLN